MRVNSYFLICFGKKEEKIRKGLNCVSLQIGFGIRKR